MNSSTAYSCLFQGMESVRVSGLQWWAAERGLMNWGRAEMLLLLAAPPTTPVSLN